MKQRLVLSPEAIAQEVSGETVILDLRSEQYFSLDPVGSRVWQCLKAGESMDTVHSQLVSEYDVDPDQLTADLESLVASLIDAGLVIRE